MKNKQTDKKPRINDAKAETAENFMWAGEAAKAINKYLGIKVYDHPEYIGVFYHMIFDAIKTAKDEDIPSSRFQYAQLEDGTIQVTDDFFEPRLLDLLNDDYGFESLHEDSNETTRSELLLQLKFRSFHLGALLALVVDRFRRYDDEERKHYLKNYPGLSETFEKLGKYAELFTTIAEEQSLATNEMKEAANQLKIAREATSDIMKLKIRIATELQRRHPLQKINPKDLSKLPEHLVLEARKTAEAFIGNNPKKVDIMKELFRTPKKVRKITAGY